MTPGERLGQLSALLPGDGTYTRGEHVYSSRVGVVACAAAAGGEAGAAGGLGGGAGGGAPQLPTVSVTPVPSRGAAVVAEVGSVVLARVVRLTTSAANVDILVVGGAPARAPLPGVVRRENVREGEVDKVVMLESFRPGDIIRATVVSLGDARAYFLSTAPPDCGVVQARSEAGAPMSPVNWQEMLCPVTQARERRKVAKFET